jgi:C1A family cysteine protease
MLSLFRKRRGLGLLAADTEAPQSSHKRDWGFDLLGLGSAPPEAEIDLTPYMNGVSLNQGTTQTCVAQSWETAIRISRGVSGLPNHELGSRLFGYSNSRATHGGEKQDAGTFLRSYAYALKKVGNCPERVWPWDPAKVNAAPPPRAFREAWAFRGIKGYFKIFDAGEARTLAVRSALLNLMPVVFGTMVDQAFLENIGVHVIDVPKGPPIGGHAMCCVGFKRYGNEYVYKVANWWGPQWRATGFAWFTEELMQWYATQDLWVVSLDSSSGRATSNLQP